VSSTVHITLAVLLTAITAPATARGQDRFLIHVDGSAARQEAWAREAAGLISAAVEGLKATYQLEARLDPSLAREGRSWEVMVMVGARDDGWEPTLFRRDDPPVNVDDLSDFLRTSAANRTGWAGQHAVRSHVRRQKTPPIAVVRLVAETAIDTLSAPAMSKRTRRLVSTLGDLPRAVQGYEFIPWREVPAQLGLTVAQRWPEDLGSCARPCAPVAAVDAWVVRGRTLALHQALMVPEGAPPLRWLGDPEEVAFVKPVRALVLGDHPPIRVHEEARLLCRFKGVTSTLVLEQGAKRRVTSSIIAHRPVRVRLEGSLVTPAHWILVATDAGDAHHDLCDGSKLLGEGECSWVPTQVGPVSLKLVSSDPKCQANPEVEPLSFTVKGGTPVNVSGHFTPAACPGAARIDFGESTLAVMPNQICVDYAVRIEPKPDGEAVTRILERVSLELRNGARSVATFHPTKPEGPASFAIDDTMAERPLHLAFKVHADRPVDVGDQQYLVRPAGLLPAGPIIIRTALQTWWPWLLGGGLALGFVGLLSVGMLRRERARHHQVVAVFRLPSFHNAWSARIQRTARREPIVDEHQPDRDIPPILRIGALRVRRDGQHYLVSIQPESGGARQQHRCKLDQVLPWGPFQVHLERWQGEK
jgi:hypothetical protein